MKKFIAFFLKRLFSVFKTNHKIVTNLNITKCQIAKFLFFKILTTSRKITANKIKAEIAKITFPMVQYVHP